MGIGRRHGRAAWPALEQPLEQRTRRQPIMTPALATEPRLHLLPKIGIDNGFMLSGMNLVLVFDLAPVHDIGQEMIQAPFAKGLATPHMPFTRLPTLRGPAPPR